MLPIDVASTFTPRKNTLDDHGNAWLANGEAVMRTEPAEAPLADLLRQVGRELDELIGRAVAAAGENANRSDWIEPRVTALGYRTCLRLIRTGQIPASRIGKRFLVRRSDVDRYIESRRVTPRRPVQRDEPSEDADDLIARELEAGRLRIVRPPPDR